MGGIVTAQSRGADASTCTASFGILFAMRELVQKAMWPVGIIDSFDIFLGSAPNTLPLKFR